MVGRNCFQRYAQVKFIFEELSIMLKKNMHQISFFTQSWKDLLIGNFALLHQNCDEITSNKNI
jgi:hypothetical protein